MKKIPRIAFLGDLTADKYMPAGDIHLGGAALNGAIWVKRLGAKPTIFSAVGSDVMGAQFLQALRRKKMSTEGIQQKSIATSSIEIFVSKDGERQYGTWDPGVLVDFHFRKKDKALLKRQDALIVTIYPPYEHVLTELRSIKNKLCVINYGDLKEFERNLDVVVRHLDVADVLVFGLDKDEDERLINDIRVLTKIHKKTAIVTLGKYGSLVWQNENMFMGPAKEIRAVDTTGAGDSFLAAFLVTYLQTRDIQKSLAKGTRLAARVIQKVGAY